MVTVAQTRADNVHAHANVTRDEFVELRERRDAGLGLPKLILPSLQVNILAGDLPPADPNGVHYLRTPVNRTIASLIGNQR